MDEKMEAMVAQLDERIRKLEGDLKRLREAKEVLLSLETGEEPQARARPKKMVDAVEVALREMGHATSAQVIEWLVQYWDEDVKPTSIRSTLSGNKDRFKNDGRE